MQKKLTITVDDKVYAGLHSVIGRGNISRFIERLARPYLFPEELEKSYREMASDKEREAQAQEWVDALTADVADETRGGLVGGIRSIHGRRNPQNKACDHCQQ